MLLPRWVGYIWTQTPAPWSLHQGTVTRFFHVESPCPVRCRVVVKVHSFYFWFIFVTTVIMKENLWPSIPESAHSLLGSLLISAALNKNGQVHILWNEHWLFVDRFRLYLKLECVYFLRHCSFYYQLNWQIENHGSMEYFDEFRWNPIYNFVAADVIPCSPYVTVHHVNQPYLYIPLDALQHVCVVAVLQLCCGYHCI